MLGGGDKVEIRAITDSGTILTNPTFTSSPNPTYTVTGNVADATTYTTAKDGMLGVNFQAPGSEKIDRVEVLWTEATGSSGAGHGLGFGLLAFDGSAAAVANDYGDAPATYGDASAIIDSDIHLGIFAPDSESGSQYNYRALADTITRPSGTVDPEEDGAPQSQWGITLFPVLIDTDTSYSTPINSAI